MLESILPALQGVVTSVKAMASFDAFLKGRKGDIRALVEELTENSRLCFRVVDDDVNPALVTSGHSVFDQASDRYIFKTGYSPVGGAKPSVKDRFRMGRSGTPDT